MRMTRLQIMIDVDDKAELKRLSAILGVPLPVMVRDGVKWAAGWYGKRLSELEKKGLVDVP